MSTDGGDKVNKPAVPPGWNDPPPISTTPGKLRAGTKLNQRVAYPLSSAGSKPKQTVEGASPPLGQPALSTQPPPIPFGLPPTVLDSTPKASEEPQANDPETSEDDSEKLEELIKYVNELNAKYGKDKSSEISHRFEIMVNMWPNLAKDTKKYVYETLKNLHNEDITKAKSFYEQLVQKCGFDVVHWILMVKILIKHVES